MQVHTWAPCSSTKKLQAYQQQRQLTVPKGKALLRKNINIQAAGEESFKTQDTESSGSNDAVDVGEIQFMRDGRRRIRIPKPEFRINALVGKDLSSSELNLQIAFDRYFPFTGTSMALTEFYKWPYLDRLPSAITPSTAVITGFPESLSAAEPITQMFSNLKGVVPASEGFDELKPPELNVQEVLLPGATPGVPSGMIFVNFQNEEEAQKLFVWLGVYQCNTCGVEMSDEGELTLLRRADEDAGDGQVVQIGIKNDVDAWELLLEELKSRSESISPEDRQQIVARLNQFIKVFDQAAFTDRVGPERTVAALRKQFPEAVVSSALGNITPVA